MAELDLTAMATMSEDEVARTLGLGTRELDQFVRTIAQNPRSTIEPVGEHAMAATLGPLEALTSGPEPREDATGLSIGRTLGEGGMGVVRVAMQRSLGREVAIKTLRPEGRSELATLRLLREAWVTGALEHPNIVPVHELVFDAQRAPIIVLKRIEGAPWETLMRDAAEVKARFGTTDLLEYNLRIFVQVCNAVSLAHARGILHRDLKPENVMIGSFGEVYLVDWGIAVSLREDPTGRLPLAADAKEVAGTPCYMAPEMLGALEGTKLSERTDVYLLGSVLHEILTGVPPHQGSFKEILASVLMSSPSYPEGISTELAAIARRAMERLPADRFSSAEELRQRIEWYLRHRGSLALSAEANTRFVELRALLEAPGDPASSRDRAYRLFAECRFAFRQALRESEDNVEAKTGLETAIRTMVVYELERGTAEAAAAVLAELPNPPSELSERVAKALALREAEKRRLERLEALDADLDPSIGRRTRAFVAMILGLLWVVLPQWGAYGDRHGFQLQWWSAYAWTSGVAVIMIVLGVWARESLSKTAMNRRGRSLMLVFLAAQLGLELGCNLLRLSFDVLMALHVFLWFVIASSFAAVVDRRLWPTAIGYFAAFVFLCLVPEARWHAITVANLVLLVNVLLAWASLDDRPKRFGGTGRT
ncbi:serine/threonine protein kinase [Labilithrix luteola]|uniref:Serine/threonine protein kinase n=1 Tax=Labilithrix luteola TaxID=1391654 RepID=A0A0K1PIV0_9BACT|nr:serine/threonine-protein kinase [Labilithrix luteola]AKU93447.1 serine/threonine protein kinase [Labilithrix luteola]